MKSLVRQNYLSELRGLDWDFDGASGNTGLAGYHWYPARFVPNVPGVLIGYFSRPGEVVLDPFCGSGTTLVEAHRLGRSSLGVDTNPAATLMSSAKLIPFEREGWKSFRDSLKHSCQHFFVRGGKSNWATISEEVPNYLENAKWYHPDTLAELSAIWQAIRAQDSEYRLVAEATFSAILRFACSQTKHWGWICDNVWPKEFVYKSAMTLFFQRLEQYATSAAELHLGQETADMQAPVAHVVRGSCATVLAGLPPRSVDLVVTSPPYFGMTDYVRSQRLTFLWFEWSLEDCRADETGARYRRRRLTALSEYMSDMGKSFMAIARVLKVGAMCAIVIGESPNRDTYLDDFEIDLAKIGFTVEARLTRNVSKRRVMKPQVHEERIILARNNADT
ncbi:DNA methyltransferase [Asanoa sp. WMMD1127]|uniref:DNA methyltransferase n=1 Tax=Asanoa sp. WMMD1127 TaxID=3016107 RepID=UPI0024169A91|nr:DNA methyltransferase [Asanoa sp. WMMD1127]MDG4821911.1 DNA methyltransferase [Asanoa sp. WMMD1127]